MTNKYVLIFLGLQRKCGSRGFISSPKIITSILANLVFPLKEVSGQLHFISLEIFMKSSQNNWHKLEAIETFKELQGSQI